MLDLRLPIGVFFLIIGAILAVYGLTHPFTTPGVSVPVEPIYGGALVLFGAVMTLFGVLAGRTRQ